MSLTQFSSSHYHTLAPLDAVLASSNPAWDCHLVLPNEGTPPFGLRRKKKKIQQTTNNLRRGGERKGERLCV